VLATLAMVKIGVILGVVVVIHWLLRNTTVLEAVYRMPWWLMGLLWSGMIVLLLLSQASSSSFIYFQF
jgi:alginate O-acetyltransferase complex protein AlgI